METLINAFSRIGDGVLFINQDKQITFWNPAAEEILGYSSQDVLGQPCYMIMNGHSDHQQLICQERCWVAKAAFNGGGVSNFDISVQTKEDGARWINVSTFSLRHNALDSGPVLVHLFRDISQQKKSEWLIHQIFFQAQQLQEEIPSHVIPPSSNELKRVELTKREREVLVLLVRGLNTKDISETLTISLATVRNHIRNILQKLDVHSRLEAVLYAINHDLV